MSTKNNKIHLPDIKMAQIAVFTNTEEIANSLGTFFLDKLSENSTGFFTVAISGGSFPKTLAQALIPHSARIDWNRVHFFLADERCVELESEDSNFGITDQELFSHISIPRENLHPIDWTLSPEECARQYQEQLQNTFGGFPAFDIIFLGMGPDGHTASLFPAHELLLEQEKWVAHIEDSPKPPPQRVTLTLPVINNAKHVVFVCTGANKADMLVNILEPSPGDNRLPLPAARVSPTSGSLLWILDIDAAQKLSNQGSSL